MVAQVEWRRLPVSAASTAAQDVTQDVENPLAEARLAFVGAGVMGESMIAGLLKNALIPPGHIVASHPRADRRQRLEEQFGIATRESNRDAAEAADLVLLTI
jgi:pyrroline-5-carboxylate reductase